MEKEDGEHIYNMEFPKLKRQIDKLLEEAENDALKKGVNITSPEFQNLLKEIKKKLLLPYELTLEEYEQYEKELETTKKKELRQVALTEQDIDEKFIFKDEEFKKVQKEILNKIQNSAQESQEKEEFLLNKIQESDEGIKKLEQELKNTKDLSTKEKMVFQQGIIGLNKRLTELVEIQNQNKEEREKKQKELEENINLLVEALTTILKHG